MGKGVCFFDTSIAVCGANQLGVSTPNCLVCGKPGKKVRPDTIKNNVKEEWL